MIGEYYLRKWTAAVLQSGPIPKHVSFIMDGNRRFGRSYKMKTFNAHAMGFETLKKTLEWCLDLGVETVTVYAFSIENFKRPKEEVDGLMVLAKDKLLHLLTNKELLDKYDISIRILGNLDLLPPDVVKVMETTVKATAHNNRSILNICFSYTAQYDMATAVQSVVTQYQNEEISINDIDEDLISNHLLTGNDRSSSPQTELLIRTSGELRLSDFMLWQCSFGLLLFFKVLWPDFSFLHLVLGFFLYQHHTRMQEFQATTRDRPEGNPQLPNPISGYLQTNFFHENDDSSLSTMNNNNNNNYNNNDCDNNNDNNNNNDNKNKNKNNNNNDNDNNNNNNNSNIHEENEFYSFVDDSGSNSNCISSDKNLLTSKCKNNAILNNSLNDINEQIQAKNRLNFYHHTTLDTQCGMN